MLASAGGAESSGATAATKTTTAAAVARQTGDGGGKSVLLLKQEMSTQLCGLLACALQCLKGGQTFQYSSLLIVNLIIDSFIRFEASTIPINWSKVFDFDSDAGKCEQAESGNRTVTAEKGEKHSSAISAAANIGKHFRNLRINESFNFKQNFANKEEKLREIRSLHVDKTSKGEAAEQTTPKKTYVPFTDILAALSTPTCFIHFYAGLIKTDFFHG